MEKFIIEKEDKEAVYLMYADEDGDVMVEGAYLTPYIEPDREKAAADAFQRGYEHAKHECADCRKIRADTEQELADKAYQKGLSDAWDAARKIADIPYDEGEKIFGVTGWHIIEKCTAAEAIEKLKAYEQERFHLGDEFENESGKRFVILKMNGTEIDRYIDEEGKTYCMTVKYKVMRKTGRHFPEIAAVLEKMREDAT